MDRNAVFSSLFFRLYGLAWRLAGPFLKRGGRLKEGFSERLAGEGWCGRQDLWIQAASGGEARLALAMLRALPAGAGLRVVLCTWTKQGREVLEAGCGELRHTHPRLELTVRYAPLDAPAVVGRALRQARPRALILLETELWPGLLGACAENGVPAHVVNGRMSKTSYELYRVILPVLRSFPLRSVHAMSGEDAARYRNIFGRGMLVPCDIQVMPNIKFDRAAEALAGPPSPELRPLFRKCGRTFLLGSVREQEEHRLAPLLGKLFAARPQACLVIAPRHMHRVSAWRDRLRDLGYRPLLASDLLREQEDTRCAPPGRVLVWDIFGNLPQLYAVADAVFVGGSLGLGGQNFLEALAAGALPCVGASLENFRWALGEDTPPSLVDAGLLNICRNRKELLAGLLAEAELRRDREEVRARFLAWLGPHTGGSRLAAQILLDALG